MGCKDCVAGKWSDAAALDLETKCKDCVAGKWSDVPALNLETKCRDCASGKWSATLGSTSSATCMATNPPKPDFAKTELALKAKIAAATVVADPLLLTSPPTASPTFHPTEKGYIVEFVQKELPALEMAVQLAITVSQGQLPLMKQVVAQGVAASVGLRSTSVGVTGVVVARRRDSDGRELKTCPESKIVLEIESAGGTAELTQLKMDLQQACTEGSLTTYVQAAAAELGTLTQCLKDQPKALPKPVVQEITVVREIAVQKRETTSNSPAATKNTALTDGEVAGIVIFVFVFVVGACIVRYS